VEGSNIAVPCFLLIAEGMDDGTLSIDSIL